MSYLSDLWIKLRNNGYIKARNAADSGDVNIIKVDGSDNIVVATAPYVGSSGSASNKLATAGDLAAAVDGLKPKAAVRLATTAPVTIAGGVLPYPTIDGSLAVSGDRILVKDQASAAENGIYVITDDTTNYIFTRATDFDSLTPIDEINGAYVPVEEGAANIGIVYVVGAPAVTNIGVSAINFVKRAVAAIQQEVLTCASASTFKDLATIAQGPTLIVTPVGGPQQRPTDDYTLSTVGGKTRITFAGDLAAIIASETVILMVEYMA